MSIKQCNAGPDLVGTLKMNEQGLKRSLQERHIRLMAVGSTIGVGLFLGSATAIDLAGPAILISYIVGGSTIFIIMRALGEMAVHKPVAGSFSRYAHNYLGPLPGCLTGWNYWFMWLVTCIASLFCHLGDFGCGSRNEYHRFKIMNG